MKKFNIFEKITSQVKVQENKVNDQNKPIGNFNCNNEPLDKLINNNLPCGWLAHNKDFTDKINTEYSYFLNNWIKSSDKSPVELYSALKSFVLYMDKVNILCKEKGECFEFWFNEILTGNGYLSKRKQELEILSLNISQMQEQYERHEMLITDLENSLLNFLKTNSGILQKDVYKHFDSSIKADIQSMLYELDNSGTIKREKSGNTYKIFYNL